MLRAFFDNDARENIRQKAITFWKHTARRSDEGLSVVRYIHHSREI
jgi:hypothetical protein